MVLLKGFGTDGFKIFTYLSSRKGRELVSVSRSCMLLLLMLVL